jgi:hypothetical protein
MIDCPSFPSHPLLSHTTPTHPHNPYAQQQSQWCPIHQPALIVLVLTLWVFICAFNRGSATYGEVAVSAALTVRVVPLRVCSCAVKGKGKEGCRCMGVGRMI